MLPDLPVSHTPGSFSRRPAPGRPYDELGSSDHATCAGATVAAKTLSGHGISTRVETSLVPDSTRSRFLTSRLIAQFLMFVDPGPGTTPAKGTGETCLRVAIARVVLRGGANQLRHTFPRLPGRIPVLASGGFFMPPCA